MDREIMPINQSQMRFNFEENLSLRGYLYMTVELIYTNPDIARRILENDSGFLTSCKVLLKSK